MDMKVTWVHLVVAAVGEALMAPIFPNLTLQYRGRRLSLRERPALQARDQWRQSRPVLGDKGQRVPCVVKAGGRDVRDGKREF